MRVTTSLIPKVENKMSVEPSRPGTQDSCEAMTVRRRTVKYNSAERKLTRIFGIFRADVLVASVQDILVHQSGAWCNLPEEANLNWLANLDALSLLYEYLPCILASVLTVKAGHSVLLWVVAFLERLEGSHEVMPASNARCNNSLSDTSSDSTLDNSCHRIHGTNHLSLELRWNMKLDLLKEVFGSAKTTHNKNVLNTC